MSRKNVVIYCRFSSDMQNPKSCTDQERVVRNGLSKLGIDHRLALVHYDEAESGTKVDRTEFQRLIEMRDRGEIGILAVDDQARLTRAGNALAFILDLVFSGGRFISVGEGIDTDQPGWELRVQVLDLHNKITIKQTGLNVRRGQEGRIAANLTAGDLRYGYESFFVNPNAVTYSGRGPKPERNVQIKESEARWVRQIFDWVVQGLSLNAIARELNRLQVPRTGRYRTKLWEHYHVRSIVDCPKYIGYWEFGKTTTLRNSKGRVKRKPVGPEQWTIKDRPDLRIIDQATWERVQVKLAELDEKYGSKDGQKKRGPKSGVHYTDVYPTRLLSGLLYCGECGARLRHRGSGSNVYLGCPNATLKTCAMATFVAVDKAEKMVIEFVQSELLGSPGWIDQVLNAMHRAIAEASTRASSDTSADEKRLREIQSQTNNLIDSLAQSGLQSNAVMERLAELEATAETLQKNIAANKSLPALPQRMPERQCVMDHMRDLVSILKDDCVNGALLLRKLLGRVTVHAVVPPGKKRGYIQLRFRVNGLSAVTSSLSHDARSDLERVANGAADAGFLSDEIRLDLGKLGRMDLWAPTIAKMRAGKVAWKEIVRVTGLRLGPAYEAWRRFVRAGKESQIEGLRPPEEKADTDGGEHDAA